MRRSRLSLAVAVSLCGLASAIELHAQKVTPATTAALVDAFTIQSAVLGEERRITVYNPELLSSNRLKAYPVLYLLDENDMTFVSGLVKYLSESNEQLPAMLVVGIDGSWTRIRDLTPTHSTIDANGVRDTSPDSWLSSSGGADKFLKYVREEVIPFVESHYKVAPYRVLDGHSVGGLATVYALLTQPDLFDGYVAIAPSLWWERGSMIALARERLAKVPGRKALFLADSPESGPFNRYVRDFRAVLTAKAPSTLRHAYVHYPTEAHGSIAAKAHYDALRFLFSRWDIAATDTTAALVLRHFEEFARRTGASLEPPLGMMSDWGQRFLRQGKVADAVIIFERNAANFPSAAQAHEDLGDGLARKGDASGARAAYARALGLDAANERVKGKLQALR